MAIRTLGRFSSSQKKLTSYASTEQSRYDDAKAHRQAVQDNLRQYLDILAGMHPPI